MDILIILCLARHVLRASIFRNPYLFVSLMYDYVLRLPKKAEIATLDVHEVFGLRAFLAKGL